MMFNPALFRDYQLGAIQALWEHFELYKGMNTHPLVAMPTASGKSWVIAGFIWLTFDVWPPSRVLCVTDDETLIKQNLDKLLKIWPNAPAGVYSAGLKRREHLMPITFGGIQSIHNKAALFGIVDLLFIDEAHMVSPRDMTMYRKFIEQLLYVNPAMRIIGLSATCYRQGLGKLTDGGVFTHVAYDLTTMDEYNRLVAAGWLCPLVSRHTRYRIDVSEVRMRGGEYVEKDQQEAVNKAEITHAVLSECVRLASDRKRWLLFATGVEHANQCAEHLEKLGVPAVPIHSKLPEKDRDRYFDDYSKGRVRAAVAMNAMVKGVDIPEIDFIGMLRHTTSTALWVQMLGRGGRIAPWAGKADCLVADFTSNTQRLGPINDPVLPTPPTKGKRPSGAPVRICPKCDTYNHTSVRTCPCGYEFPERVKFSPEASNLDVMKKSSTMPEVEILDVRNVTYQKQKGRGDKPPALRVTYFCTFQAVREFVSIEHPSHKYKAANWWLEHMPGADVPKTVDEALSVASFLRVPAKIRVWQKQPYPEVLTRIYA